jgi:hypothetical protein
MATEQKLHHCHVKGQNTVKKFFILTFCLNKISDQEQEIGYKCAFSKPMKPGG